MHQAGAGKVPGCLFGRISGGQDRSDVHVHTVQLSIGGKDGEIEGKIEGIIFRNRGQIEGILKKIESKIRLFISSISRVQLFLNTDYQVSIP